MRREELSTADLAGQPPTSPERSDVTKAEGDLARHQRTETADRTDAAAPTDDDVARDDLAPGLARDDHPGEPALTEGRSPDRATEVEPGEHPQPLRHADAGPEAT